jgi:hypothetical protein
MANCKIPSVLASQHGPTHCSPADLTCPFFIPQLQKFLQNLGSNDPAVSYDNCASDDFKKTFSIKSWDYVRDNQQWSNCQHLKFWWASKIIPAPWYTSADLQFTPMSIMGQAIPNSENSFDEFQLLDGKVNSAKQAYVDLIFCSVLSNQYKTVADRDSPSSRAWSFRFANYIRNYQKCIKKENWAEAMDKVRLVIWTLKYVSILYSCSIIQRFFFFVLFILVLHSEIDGKSPIVQGYRSHLQGTGNKNRGLAVSRRQIYERVHASNSKLTFA